MMMMMMMMMMKKKKKEEEEEEKIGTHLEKVKDDRVRRLNGMPWTDLSVLQVPNGASCLKYQKKEVCYRRRVRKVR